MKNIDQMYVRILCAQYKVYNPKAKNAKSEYSIAV